MIVRLQIPGLSGGTRSFLVATGFQQLPKPLSEEKQIHAYELWLISIFRY